MFTVIKYGKKIAQYRSVAQIEAWAARIRLDLTTCEVLYQSSLINHNEWVHPNFL